MKTSVKKLFLLATIIFFPYVVQAESLCSYSEQAEINEIVSNVKANYELVEIYAGKSYDVDNPREDGTFPEVDVYTKNFKISILNLTEDIFVKVRNSDDEEIYTFRNSDVIDGIASFQTNKKYEPVTYTIEVYSNKFSCAGEKFREFSIVTPMYNYYAKEEICKSNPDFYYCQEYIPTQNISLNEFKTKFQEYQQQKQKKEEQKKEENKNILKKIKDFFKNNATLIYISGVVIVIMGVSTTVILVKKKRSRVI